MLEQSSIFEQNLPFIKTDRRSISNVRRYGRSDILQTRALKTRLYG